LASDNSGTNIQGIFEKMLSPKMLAVPQRWDAWPPKARAQISKLLKGKTREAEKR
jgi:hypothetical protein